MRPDLSPLLSFLRHAAVALGAAAAVVLASAAPASASTPALGGVSARPVAADGTPLGGAYFDVERDPGTTYQAHVEITNSTDRAIPVHVAPVDATTSENGGTAFLDRAAARRQVGAWTSPHDRAITLGAGSSTRVDFTVSVPRDAEPGDHVGGIVVEPDRKLRLPSSAGIDRVVRVVLAVRIRVPGDARTAVDVSRLRFARGATGQPPTLTVQLANSGARLCKPRLTATFSQDGEVRSAERRNVDTLLPETAVDYAIGWGDPIPNGTYDVLVRTEGCGAPSAVRDIVVLDSNGSAHVAPAVPAVRPEGSDRQPLVQFAAIGVLLLATMAVGWRLARRPPRRRSRRERAAG